MRVFPSLKPRASQYQVRVSHDIDWPRSRDGKSLKTTVKDCARDVLRHSSWQHATKRFVAYAGAALRISNYDPFDTFSFLARESTRRHLKSAFYFITDQTAGSIDGAYSLDDSWIQARMKAMADGGHEIGLHPSYNTYRDASQTRREFERLRSTCERLSIHQTEWGGRQHYLRWCNPDTWRNWDDAGLAYDSTLGYADDIGFRVGTCHEYQTFDLKTRKLLKLRERPLIVMDATLLVYLRLPPAQALKTATALAAQCRRVGGTFTLLWHNSSLVTKQQKALYLQLLDAVV
jgi:hypothetical protein